MAEVDVAGEFETIRRLFAPLAHPEWGRGLTDDVAVVPSRPGHDLVLTKDAMVEGVHFLATDPLDTVARKLMRVNLSDLAAKGAEPFGYLLACHWSPRCGWPERMTFVAGLRVDQQAFGVALLGGDTVSTPGPASFSMTLLGWTPKGRTVGRAGARPGDLVFVTGAIGDGWLGLEAVQGKLSLDAERVAALSDHYRAPMPRTEFALPIRDMATASIDVSDGLIADLGHLAEAGRVHIEIDLETVPLSAAGQAWFDGRVDEQAALEKLVTGGDDYELAFTATARDEAALRREAERRHLRLTRIGRVSAGQGVAARFAGQPVTFDRPGFTHG
ncbi:MAG: thiamine-phosphate kinase [Brevundimonas sp.]|uniref:thiamine-phosphate kinase n=1 Tax=Brevundimonas sp. TaxID=1871086 RepID=UPI0027180490|nr:thiamine-phosphate kinase [Brevundimonas sp.]MDO9588312.1 thiamine-phosphate kinase [Brevundimonas sp.]MDP3369931.1 thiamine-phosphate kinase [Brevundimonas sp.]MDP3657650.1 thiamine-phosphate kinase [Brevundimonas sp.]MDZ4110054.1 thiamine-phosphate kinase [Brevundimonas sp.]